MAEAAWNLTRSEREALSKDMAFFTSSEREVEGRRESLWRRTEEVWVEVEPAREERRREDFNTVRGREESMGKWRLLFRRWVRKER